MPISRTRLPFKSTVVYSNNDEYLSPERALEFSEQWGSEPVLIKNAGHINTAAGYGEWLYGESLIESLSDIRLEKKTIDEELISMKFR
jgi:predicted alpha/beta hydrolase family esterase